MAGSPGYFVVFCREAAAEKTGRKIFRGAFYEAGGIFTVTEYRLQIEPDKITKKRYKN